MVILSAVWALGLFLTAANRSGQSLGLSSALRPSPSALDPNLSFNQGSWWEKKRHFPSSTTPPNGLFAWPCLEDQGRSGSWEQETEQRTCQSQSCRMSWDPPFPSLLPAPPDPSPFEGEAHYFSLYSSALLQSMCLTTQHATGLTILPQFQLNNKIDNL